MVRETNADKAQRFPSCLLNVVNTLFYCGSYSITCGEQAICYFCISFQLEPAQNIPKSVGASFLKYD